MREFIKFGLGNQLVGASDGDIRIEEVAAALARPIVEAHHYSHKVAPNSFVSFFVNGGEGVIQLGYGIRPKLKQKISPLITEKNFCEFDRMWLSDTLPKFSESRVIGLLLWYIKFRWPELRFIITYADGSVGNKGTIYQATNAIEIEGKDVDFYILPTGERVHPVSMWHRHKTRAFEMMEKIYPGIVWVRGKSVKGYVGQPWVDIEKVRGAKQRRYVYVLDRKLRQLFLETLRKVSKKRSEPAPVLTTQTAEITESLLPASWR